VSDHEQSFYLQKEVAALCRVHPRTVGEWIRLGKLLALKTPGGQYRIPADAVHKMMIGASTG
jgi:excisionase family DNA binding protein